MNDNLIIPFLTQTSSDDGRINENNNQNSVASKYLKDEDNHEDVFSQTMVPTPINYGKTLSRTTFNIPDEINQYNDNDQHNDNMNLNYQEEEDESLNNSDLTANSLLCDSKEEIIDSLVVEKNESKELMLLQTTNDKNCYNDDDSDFEWSSTSFQFPNPPPHRKVNTKHSVVHNKEKKKVTFSDSNNKYYAPRSPEWWEKIKATTKPINTHKLTFGKQLSIYGTVLTPFRKQIPLKDKVLNWGQSSTMNQTNIGTDNIVHNEETNDLSSNNKIEITIEKEVCLYTYYL